MFGEPVVTTLVRFFVCVRGCGCLLSTRLSLRPLPFEGQDFCIARAQMASREGGRAPECDESSWLFEILERTRQTKKAPREGAPLLLGFYETRIPRKITANSTSRTQPDAASSRSAPLRSSSIQYSCR